MTRRWSLRTRFVLAATACLLPLLGVSVYVLYQSLEHNREQLIDTETVVSGVVATGIAKTLEENQAVLEQIAGASSVQAMAGESRNGAPVQANQDASVLAHALAFRPGLKGMFLVGTDGSVLDHAGMDPALLRDQASGAIDRALGPGETGVSGRLVMPETEGGAVVVLAVPVLPALGEADDAGVPTETAPVDADGKPIGAMAAMISVERLKEALPSVAESADTTVVVVDSIGVVATSAPDQEAERLRGQYDPARVSRAFSYDDTTGSGRLGVVTPVVFPGVDWNVLVSNPSPTTYGPNRQLLRLGIAALVGAVLATLALTLFLGERTARPLRRLTDQAAALARGDFTPRADPAVDDISGGSEVHGLALAFREMAGRLATQVEDLKTARGARERQAVELRELNRRTVRLQEDERRRIAGEIHDAVSPLITGALYHARALALTSGNGSGGNGSGGDGSALARERDAGLAAVGDLLARASDELHGVVFALRPPDLDDLGVVAAIERYIGGLQPAGLTIRVEAADEPPPLSPEVRIGVYRIVQEALHNIVRHAGADEAVVSFETPGDRLRVTIRDNGAGFNPERAMRPTSLGLLSMRERAAAIGATLEIVSAAGLGTAVVLERPLSVPYTDPSFPAIVPLDDGEPARPAAITGSEIARPEAPAAAPRAGLPLGRLRVGPVGGGR